MRFDAYQYEVQKIGFKPSHYEELDLTLGATPEEIDKKHRELAKEWHPDRHPEHEAAAEEHYKAISAAHSCLSDPEFRKGYDTWLQQKEEDAEDPGFASTVDPGFSPPSPPPPPASSTSSTGGTGPRRQKVTAPPTGPTESQARQARVQANRARHAREQKAQEAKEQQERAAQEKAAAEAADARTRRRLAWFAVAVMTAIVLAVIMALAGGRGSSSHNAASTAVLNSVHSKTSQELAAAAEREKQQEEQSAVEARIDSLSFKCKKRYICQLMLAGEKALHLPVYLEGMDENLLNYLSEHGYTDRWIDSDHLFSVQSIGEGEGGLNRFIPSETEEEFRYLGSVGGNGAPNSGLMFENENGNAGSTEGLSPPEVPLRQTTPWTISWELKNSTGKVVRRLHYTVQVESCIEVDNEGTTPCDHSFDTKYEPEPTYNLPPVFPYE